jgi:hypothetical protein
MSKVSQKIEEQFIYTIKHTQHLLNKLEKAYNETIKYSYETEEYFPYMDTTDFMIDGLKTPNTYINKEYNKLNRKAVIILTINEDIHIYINIYYTKGDKDNKELIKKCIRRIYCMIKVFGDKENLYKYNHTQINILLYNAPRVMTSEYTDTPEEMNDIHDGHYFNCTCGYAMIENDKFRICVTRKNGCLGLLTHELGHICQLDLGGFKNGEYEFPNDRLKKWKYIVKKYFDIHENCHIGTMTEGVNNGNSSIIHAMFLALEKSNYNVHDNILKLYEQFYYQEYLYSIKMLCRLLKWFKYHTLRELLIISQRKYLQTSLLLEYILVRCIYLINFETLGLILDDKEKTIDDDNYILLFFEKLKQSEEVINYVLKHIHNIGIITMEYYYNK